MYYRPGGSGRSSRFNREVAECAQCSMFYAITGINVGKPACVLRFDFALRPWALSDHANGTYQAMGSYEYVSRASYGTACLFASRNGGLVQLRANASWSCIF